MRDDVEKAILESFDVRRHAAELQIERGMSDTGQRSQVTSGKHLDGIAGIISADIEACGIDSKDIHVGNANVELPGWFRATKKWDILAFSGKDLIAAVELKSIYGSYGNNLNNRAEEAVGESTDAVYSVNRKLMNITTPPLFAYALIVKKDQKSSSKCNAPKEPFFKADPVFADTSYIERFGILCQRLRREGLFGAVWFVVVDPVERTVEEPDSELTYEKFMAEIKGKIGVFNT